MSLSTLLRQVRGLPAEPPQPAPAPPPQRKRRRSRSRKQAPAEEASKRAARGEETAESSEEEESAGLDDSVGSYQALLSSLASAASASASLKRRVREAEGHSSGESEAEEESEEESEEEDVEENDSDEFEDAQEEEERLPSVTEEASPSSEDEEEGAAAVASGKDSLAQFPAEAAVLEYLNRPLSLAEAASLSSAPRKWQPVDPSVVPKALSSAFPRTDFLSAGGASLPRKMLQSLDEAGFRGRLLAGWDRATRGGSEQKGSSRPHAFASPRQAALFSLLQTGSDLLLPSRPYATSFLAADEAMDATLLHVLGHLTATAELQRRNSRAMRSRDDAGRAPAEPERDQGLTQATVLLLLPMRADALRWTRRLWELAVAETRTDSIKGKERFLEEFGSEESDAEAEDGLRNSLKPLEHAVLFGGNTDDHFVMGIRLGTGQVRLFADPFGCDILVMSPLALAQLAEGKRREELDALSSVEIAVLDRADVMLMQNWAHVQTAVRHLNRPPIKPRGADIRRVRESAADGLARHFRQTLLFSSWEAAEMSALLRAGVSARGAIALRPRHPGIVGQVIPRLRHLFERCGAGRGGGRSGGAGGGAASSAPRQTSDAKLDYFKESIWPTLRDSSRPNYLIYCPSYFDYVRVRNFLRAQSASLLCMCEYTDRTDAARARSYFAAGRRRILLTTERSQFYHRGRIRGVRNALFWGVPQHAHFYVEVCNLLEESQGGGDGVVTTLLGREDALALARLVGSERASIMLAGKTNTFVMQ